MATVPVSVAPDYYVQTAKVVQVARICQTASAFVVLYDHAITFDREVDHVWNLRLSFGSVNYILIRYIGDALAIFDIIAFLGLGVPTINVCGKVYFFAHSWLSLLVLFLIQLMLQAQLYALYQGSKIILALMIFGYLCEIAAMSIIMGFLGAESQITNEVLPGLYVCANVHAPSFWHQYVLWLPAVVYDGMLCLLALWHGVGHWMFAYRTGKRADWMGIEDGLVMGNVAYFFCVVLGCIVSVVIGQCLGLEWTEVSEGYPATMEAMVGCRLILSLRSLLVQDVQKDRDEVGEDAPWAAAPLTSTRLV